MPKINYEIEKGRLGADPEISYTKDDTTIAKVNIAVNQYYYDKKEEEWVQKGETSWINGAAFGYTAECIESMELQKGEEVFVKGTMEADVWEDEDGDERKGWNFYINQLFRVPSVDFDDEDEEDERPRKNSRKKKKGKGSSRKKKSTTRKKKKFKSKKKSGKKGGSYADKVLAQLNKDK